MPDQHSNLESGNTSSTSSSLGENTRPPVSPPRADQATRSQTSSTDHQPDQAQVAGQSNGANHIGRPPVNATGRESSTRDSQPTSSPHVREQATRQSTGNLYSPSFFATLRPPSSDSAVMLVVGPNGARGEVIPQSDPFAVPEAGLGVSFPFGDRGTQNPSHAASDGNAQPTSTSAANQRVDNAIRSSQANLSQSTSTYTDRLHDALLGSGHGKGHERSGSQNSTSSGREDMGSSPAYKPDRSDSERSDSTPQQANQHVQGFGDNTSQPVRSGSHHRSNEDARTHDRASRGPTDHMQPTEINDQDGRLQAIVATQREFQGVMRQLCGPVSDENRARLEARADYLRQQYAMLERNDDKYQKADPRSHPEDPGRQILRLMDFRNTGVHITLRSNEGLPLANHRVNVGFVDGNTGQHASEMVMNTDQDGTVTFSRDSALVPSNGTIHIRAEGVDQSGAHQIANGVISFERNATNLHFVATTTQIPRAETTQALGSTAVQNTLGDQGQVGVQLGVPGQRQVTGQWQRSEQQQTTNTATTMRQTMRTFNDQGPGLAIVQIVHNQQR